MAEVVTKIPALLTKGGIGSLTFKNRIVMASMSLKKCVKGVPTSEVTDFYTQRANAGLVITENAAVSKEAHTYAAAGGIYNSEQVEGWKRVVDAVHGKDGKIFAQLTHLGRSCLDVFDHQALAPTALAIKGRYVSPTTGQERPWAVPKEMTKDDMKRVIEDFTKAARNAYEAGFDGIQIDAGHGGLLDTFIRSSTNHRQDGYNGDAEGRTRYPIEVMEAVMTVYGNRAGIKLTPVDTWNDISDSNPIKTYTLLINKLEKLGVGFMELKEQVPSEPGAHSGSPCLNIPTICGQFRMNFSGKIIANGGFNPERGNQILESGDANFVSFGSLFLTYPDLVERIQNGKPTNPLDQFIKEVQGTASGAKKKTILSGS